MSHSEECEMSSSNTEGKEYVSSGPPERSDSVASLRSNFSQDKHLNFTDEDPLPQHSILQESLQRLVIQPKEKSEVVGRETSHAVEILQKLKSHLRVKFQCLYEGPANEFTQTLLSDIYTDLYITESGSDEISTEHEIRQIEIMSTRLPAEDMEIKCNDIFKPSPGQDKPIRTVLTKGVAGIGKTASVQKFILDWSEEKANSDVHLIFPLPFRELNLLKDEELSLMALLDRFFAVTKDMDISSHNYKIIFIFDGLDECRLPLDFQNNVKISDVSKSASVDVLLTNLIMRNLLPSALIWITSRPASAHQIPSEYIDRVTEVRGFNDSQKEEYFKKKISDPAMASKIINHIKSTNTLHVMCHIPVFCWILATVLERTIQEEEIPKTLTQMYTHFLVVQTKQKMNDDMILKLGKLAFDQLMKDNLIFYEEDLSDCGIDVNEASMFLGVCTKLFKQEVGLFQKKVYYFVHLSIQEHLAALYVHLTFVKHNTNILDQSWLPRQFLWGEITISELHKCAVDRALKDKNGHLDLFLRFLLGLSLESNLLQGILTHAGSSVNNTEETTAYIKNKIQENPPAEKSINLFHCLSELNDHSLEQEIKTYLNSGEIKQKQTTLSSSHWSALVFVLLSSAEELKEFDLSTYTGAHNRSEEVVLKLLPVVKASKKAELNSCNLTNRTCVALASVISSGTSRLRELNLSWNELLDSGVQQLCSGLGNPHCKLEKLKLINCGFRSEGCCALASALKSNLFHLIELDLSQNDLEDTGVKELSDGLQNPQCKLKILTLASCRVKDEGCAALATALKSNPSALRGLDLSENEVGDLGVKQLASALENPLCTLETLRLWDCNITEEGCTILASALRSNPSHLRQLDLCKNNILDSGLKLLSAELEKPQLKIEILRLRHCGVTDEGCAALVLALKSNPSHLIELNMSGNNLDTGLKQLNALKEDPHYRLEKVTVLQVLQRIADDQQWLC
ncbi:NACHT, LRR and PYD domains-containing protein 3-like isoform X2 [Colossoma macropomum]|uniref:NACHT, LRR and PYD domains-containing protein 3-like isoform X2 n=1 Tax=Colossoma macropomum TaxID=42526 RepID=UPI00186514C7|nr:NACHT, LRR and PYD domains-containing protein 3-like isoform X2 [Colossoma macropomum]